MCLNKLVYIALIGVFLFSACGMPRELDEPYVNTLELITVDVGNLAKFIEVPSNAGMDAVVIQFDNGNVYTASYFSSHCLNPYPDTMYVKMYCFRKGRISEIPTIGANYYLYELSSKAGGCMTASYNYILSQDLLTRETL